MTSPTLVLGSSSKARRLLLERLKMPFVVHSPDVDETPLSDEKPSALVVRLAEKKARATAENYPQDIIIGADQVGVLEEKILGKPLTEEAAIKQLQFMRGKMVRFYIGLCLLDQRKQHCETVLETFDVYFRVLTDEQIRSYVAKDQPLQCAGSFRAEGFGICLVEKFVGDDYTALIGLPLIRLTSMLEKVNFSPLQK